MIAVAVILLIIAVFISIVFAFVEISNLKNVSFGQSNQELAKLNSKCEANGQMLNVSMLKLNLLRQDYSMLENRTQELIETTDYFLILNDQFDTVQQMLNTSFDQLNQELAKLNNKCEANGRMLNVSMLKLNQLRQDYSVLENRTQELINNLESPGLYPNYPAASCAAILQFVPFSPSGHYWIRSSNGSAVHVYCDMTRSCGNITGGWTRVVELDMSNTSQQCPSSWTMTSSPARSCFASTPRTCPGTVFPNPGLTYSHICGRAIGYCTGTTDAFAEIFNFRNSPSIDEPYVDGISVTHGSPRQHASSAVLVIILTMLSRPCKLNSLFIVTRFLNLHEGGRSIFNIQYNYDQIITH